MAMKSPPPIRVLVVEDVPLLREGLRCLLEKQGLTVVGAISNGGEVLQEITKSRPDVLLLDMDLPELYWRMLLGYLTTHGHQAKVLMLTSATDGEEKPLRALQAGARGYLSKLVSPEDLIKAIRLVAAGEVWTSRKLLPRLVQELTHLPLPVPQVNGARLTRSEQQVFRLLTQGLGNKAIAQRLGIGEATVKTHLHHIFRKTGLNSRLQLTLLLKSS